MRIGEDRGEDEAGVGGEDRGEDTGEDRGLPVRIEAGGGMTTSARRPALVV